jgi:hypothetical protein
LLDGFRAPFLKLLIEPLDECVHKLIPTVPKC